MIQSHDVTQAPVIIEIKVAKTYKALGACCQEGLDQIEQKRYDAGFPEDGYAKVLHCGVAFYKKQCRVRFREKVFEEIV